MKKSEFISRVVNGLNAVNKDSRISKRYILHVGTNIVKDFVAKHFQNGKLLKDLDLVTYIDCFPMVKHDTIKCDIVEFKRCKKLMKSECKLPELFGSEMGNSIIAVYSLDESVELKPITLSQYRRNQDRRQSDVLYYYEKDGYLYIPDSDVKRVGLSVLSLFPEDADCGCEEKDECQDIYDTKFVVPAKFIDNVVKATIQEIAFKKQIPVDVNPNLRENA